MTDCILRSPCTGELWYTWSLEEKFEHVLTYYIVERHAREKHTLGGDE